MELRRMDIRDGAELARELPPRRDIGLPAEVLRTASEILEEVRQCGDEALIQYTKRFDGVDPVPMRVTEDEIAQAIASVGADFIEAIADAAIEIEEFHQRQRTNSWFVTREDGSLVGQRVLPLDRVGIYVPGGRAVYPSTVLMNAIPAMVAGVPEVAMVVPPQLDGSVNPFVLAAADQAGVAEIYRVGGAQAIAALAYGTETIPAVDKICGPGNAYVAAAKSLVSGVVAIDMIAGPSEVLIVADDTADPRFVAIDMMAQAEHDPRARAVLVTTEPELVGAVEDALEAELAGSPRADIIRQALEAVGLAVVVPDLATAIAAANAVAPEHLELMVDEPFSALSLVRHAGAVFLGPWTPEAVGDYVAGPNHTLPTGGTARFSSVLGVQDFQKRSSVISYTREALAADARTVRVIAEAEGLPAHARSVAVRLEAGGDGPEEARLAARRTEGAGRRESDEASAAQTSDG
jgi:histidinol dehydrogenase